MEAEIVGPGMHDGMYITLPESAVGFVLLTPDQDGVLQGSLSIRSRSCGVDLDDVAAVLLALALNLPESRG